MNTSIYRRAPALRWLPFSWTIASAFAWTLAGTLSRLQENDVGSHQSWLWAVLTPILLGSLQGSVVVAKIAGMQTRANEFELGLPITQQSIVRQRLAMRLTVFVSPVLFACVVTWIRASDVAPFSSILAAGLATAGAICSATCVFHAFWPGAAKLNAAQLIMLIPVAMLLMFSPMAFDEMGIRGYGAPILVPLALGLLVRCFHICEYRFDEPLEGEPSSGKARAAREADGDPAVFSSPPLGPLRWSILRGAFLRPETMPVIAFYIFIGFTGVSSLFGQLWTLFVMSLIVSAVLLRQALPVVGGVAGLPIPRRRFGPLLLLPVLGMALIALVLKEAGPSNHLSEYRFPNGVAVDGSSGDRTLTGFGRNHPHVRVPGNRWRFTRLDADRTITAPWGESVTPLAHPVFWGSSLVAYNPFDVAENSSILFMAWQLGRAIEEVHGETLSDAEVLERWYAGVALPELRETVAMARTRRRTHHELGLAELPGDALARGWMDVLTVVFGWCLGGLVSMSVHRPRYGVTKARRRLAVQCIAAAAFLATIFTLAIWSGEDRHLALVVDAKLRSTLGWIAGGSTEALVALTAVVTALGYWALIQRLERIEIPPPVKNGWTGKPRGVFG